MSIYRKCVFISRCVLGFTVTSACAIYGVITSAVLFLIGKNHIAQYLVARAMYHLFSLVLAVDVKIIDAEKLDNLPAIIISNHQSELDLLIMGKVFPVGCTTTAKSSLKWVPVLGWFMSWSDTFFLDRSSREKSIRTLNRALQKLKKEKRAVWVFPEGTRSYSTKLELLPFKKGAFHLAQQGNIPIIPVVVSNSSVIFHPGRGIFNRGLITCKVLDPIRTDGIAKEDIGDLASKVHDIMQEEYVKLGYSSAINDTGMPDLSSE
ncbi:HBL399Cp [Eremothecium sinecaudum]|uniref:1-acyl-sn-glycerol-3-phosphate acyltransferase n=1 Tax=Eremothecium sinecaudum TaxID=45286 RepID=A0A109UVZ2_9SACH|nr:HBL399Cp [Eremothecium sinecaudum]AMD18503.1 HBL399Cp [Eremothecium sinecaudum]